MNIDGKTALVTGATGGLGIAIARELHAAGAKLVLTGRRREVLEELAAEVKGKFFVCDLADRAQLEELARSHADVDILINNAGLPGTGFFLDFEMDRIDRILDVNLRAAIYLTRVAAEKMAERRSGHVVFVSSVAGLIGSPRGSIYSATKFGLRGFAQALRHDLAELGIGVSTILPGFVREAGMFAETGLEPPQGLGTSSPKEVAVEVRKAIENNKAEIVVAPLQTKIAATIGSLLPSLSQRVQASSIARQFATKLSESQREKL